jgi:hypothetical protein
LPDGCIELIFNLAEKFRRHHSGGEIEIQPETLIAGQMRRYAMIEPAGRVKLFGVRFHPHGAHPFFQFALSELTDQLERKFQQIVGITPKFLCRTLRFQKILYL